MPGLVFFSFAALFAFIPPAGASDTCRYFGEDFEQGARICMETPAGPRWADCVMVLNNPSWRPVTDACPQATIRKERTSGKALDYIRQYIEDNKKR